MKFFHDILDLICTAVIVIGFVILGPLAVATLTGNRSVCSVTFGYFLAFLAASAWLGKKTESETRNNQKNKLCLICGDCGGHYESLIHCSCCGKWVCSDCGWSNHLWIDNDFMYVK